MKFTAAALLILASFASAETSVKQYEGPTDCSDDEKVTPGSFLEMHTLEMSTNLDLCTPQI